MIPSVVMKLSSLSLSRSFIIQTPSYIPTFLWPFYFKEKSHWFWLVVLLDTLKYSRQPVAMGLYDIISYKVPGHSGLLSPAWSPMWWVHKHYNSWPKSIVTWLINKAVSPWQVDSPINDKNCSYHRCRIKNFTKLISNVLVVVIGYIHIE